jgi:hypothetical protein
MHRVGLLYKYNSRYTVNQILKKCNLHWKCAILSGIGTTMDNIAYMATESTRFPCLNLNIEETRRQIIR